MFRPIEDTSGKTGSAPTLQKGTWLFSTDGTAVPLFMTTDADKLYYYLNAARETIGPKTLAQLEEMMKKGEVSGETLIASEGDPEWIRLSAILGSTQATPEDREVGLCPQCGEPLRSEGGYLPQHCPACAFAVDTPHETNNLLANFWFTFTKKYCCFRGRATRVEYWSFVLISWLLSQSVGYLCNAIRSAVTGISLTQAEIEEQVALILEDIDLSELLRATADLMMQILGILPPEGGITMAYLANIALLILPQLVMLVFILPQWGVTVRRLHDVGRSGKWFVAFLVLGAVICGSCIALLAYIFGHEGNVEGTVMLVSMGMLLASYILLFLLGILLLVFCLLDSRRGSNQYGPSPKYPLGN